MKEPKPEIHNLIVRPFIDEGRALLGDARLEALLEPLGVSRAAIEDRNGWFSLRALESILIAIDAEAADPSLVERCARLAVTPEYAGLLRPLFRAFGSPHFAFSQVAQATGRFNKVGAMELLSRGRTSVTVAYRALPGAPREHARIVCRGRAANLGALPTMFDLPPAHVRHPQCMHDGAEQCVYEIRWKPLRGRRRAWSGAALGVTLGLVASLALGFSAPLTVACAALAAIAFGGVGRTRDLSVELAERASDVAAQQDALTKSAKVNEARYAELLDAKSEVERKVDQRTAELRETSRKLEETLVEVRELDRAKTDFFSNVSHELRTPLSLILGPLGELRAGRTPAGGTESAVDTMHRNTLRLLGLINQLLDLAKVDAGAVELDRSSIDPVEIAKAVASAFRANADKQRVALTVEAPPSTALIPLDVGWVETAISNLVANAMRFVEPGGHVVLRVVDRGADVVIEVEDDGSGMDERDLARIFERFTQVGESRGRRVGTGLGLAIVREAARLHGGDAKVRSVLGKGTCFTLTFPRVVDAAPATTVPSAPPLAAATAAADSAAVSSADETREGPTTDAPLALVVEDNADLRGYIADVLSGSYRVRTAVDGEQGLRMADELVPDVVVSDIAMPGMSGIELCAALRARERTRATPLILVTAYRDVGRVLEAFEAGASDYVTKPFHGRELLARVDVHVRLRQMIRDMAHRERLAMLGTVAASVAHQVRNPLTSIVSGLPAVRRRLAASLDPSTLEMFDVMADSAERIERMTLDLLDVSRIDREAHGAFRPGQSLEAAIRLVSSTLAANVRIEADIDKVITIHGRVGDVNHVFLNLLDNAARAVGESGLIRVSGRAEGAAYVVDVDDSGPGVPLADRERIFEPFFTSRAAGEGTGLGLSIAKSVVDQHGGRIHVVASSLGGARFEVVLPIGNSAASVLRLGDNEQRSRKETASLS